MGTIFDAVGYISLFFVVSYIVCILLFMTSVAFNCVSLFPIL